MKKKFVLLFLLALFLVPTFAVDAQPSGLPVDVPREELFIVDQIFRYSVMENYNIWLNGPHDATRHALMMETLWYIDQETGERLYGAAISDPMYNEDYTQLSVDLREDLYWSDGVQFTADDLVFTIETIIAVPEMNKAGWHTGLSQYVESVEKTGDFSVTVNLLESNPRFHTYFETRWSGVYMMPKHIYETVEDLATFNDPDPVVLGTYYPIQADPTGYWELYERREDWERTVAGMTVNNPGPKYILSIFYGDSTKKAIAMSRGELDVFFDVDFEAFETVLDTTPTARSWYTDFPWAYPNEIDSRHFAFNYESQPLFQNKDVRWALALSLNIVELQTEYIGGVAKVTPIPIPATAPLMEMYHTPLEEWLQELELDLGDGEMYHPYDTTIPDQIASWAEDQGYTVPGEPDDVFGPGWWKFDTEAASKLLIKNGFTLDDDEWYTPDGERFSIMLQSPPDENDAFRMATAAADMWSDFGIDVDLQGLERSVYDQNNYVGQYDIATPWYSFALASGDSWPQVNGWHPDYYVPNGEDYRTKGGSDMMRLNDAQVGEYIDQMAVIPPDSEENLEISLELVKHWVENMNFITVISFKKFVTWDERYWTGFPTAENPNYMPLYWFQGGKFAFQELTPVAQ